MHLQSEIAWKNGNHHEYVTGHYWKLKKVIEKLNFQIIFENDMEAVWRSENIGWILNVRWSKYRENIIGVLEDKQPELAE